MASIDGGASTTNATPLSTLSTEGTHTIFYSAKDNAGNATSTSRTVVVDGTAPAATHYHRLKRPDHRQSYLHASVTFSEPIDIATFGQGDLSVSGAGLSNFAASSTNPLVYTFDLIPTASDVVVIIQAGTYQDLAGNQNIAEADFEITYSPLLPTQTSTPSTSGGGGGGGGVLGGPLSVGFSSTAA